MTEHAAAMSLWVGLSLLVVAVDLDATPWVVGAWMVWAGHRYLERGR